MPRGRSSEDTSLMAMALIGYEAEKHRIEEKIQELRARLGGGVASPAARPSTVAAPVVGRKRVLSVAARKRIAAAQRKRWAEHRKKMAAAKQ